MSSFIKMGITGGHSRWYTMYVGPTVDTKTYIFTHFYSQQLVLFTMVPRNSTHTRASFYAVIFLLTMGKKVQANVERHARLCMEICLSRRGFSKGHQVRCVPRLSVAFRGTPLRNSPQLGCVLPCLHIRCNPTSYQVHNNSVVSKSGIGFPKTHARPPARPLKTPLQSFLGKRQAREGGREEGGEMRQAMPRKTGREHTTHAFVLPSIGKKDTPPPCRYLCVLV